MSDFKIFSGRSSISFASKVVKNLDMPLSEVTIKEFSSGEVYLNLEESVRGKEVFVIQTTRPKMVHTDYFELFLMIDAFRRGFATRINVVIPYFSYARQDKIHSSREPISAKLMADLLTTSGADNIITYNLHSDQIQGFFDVPLDNIKPKQLFLKYLNDLNLSNPVLVSPDTGSAKMVKLYADLLGWPMAILHKSRPLHQKTEVNHIIGDVVSKQAVILDDMIDTGGSVATAKQAIIDAGAQKDVYLMATHGVFSGEAEDKLNKANFAKIVVTDTLPNEHKNINNLEVLSVTPMLSKIIGRIAKQEPISDLYF